eukprot:1119210-Prorocentrum_minimum.AAC.6
MTAWCENPVVRPDSARAPLSRYADDVLCRCTLHITAWRSTRAKRRRGCPSLTNDPAEKGWRGEPSRARSRMPPHQPTVLPQAPHLNAYLYVGKVKAPSE